MENIWVGGACGMYGTGERCMQGVGVEDLSERVHFEYVVIGWRIILKWIIRTFFRRTWTGLI
jgi:hypothetical protein